jgi:hypothetical protein
MGSTLNFSSAHSGGGSGGNGARGAMRLALAFASTMEWRCGLPPGYMSQTLQPTLSGLGLACPDLVLQHVHALVTTRTRSSVFASLRSDAANTSASEVGRAAVMVEVVDEFLGRYSHELGVEARLRVRWASSGRAPPAGPNSCLRSWIHGHRI